MTDKMTTDDKTTDDVWIIVRQRFDAIDPVAFELLARANEPTIKRNGKIKAIVPGPALADVELQRLFAYGADEVYTLESSDLAEFSADRYAAVLTQFVQQYQPDILLAAADTFGRTLMPYLAMKLQTGLTADCTRLEVDPKTGLLLQTRPAIGGNIMATIKCVSHRPQMATVRPHSFRPLEPDSQRCGEPVRIPVDLSNQKGRVSVLRFIPDRSGNSLADADKIVVVGRGIKRAENLEKIRPFVQAIGAALGATREVVDRGWLDYSHQIGLSGRTVSPRLYIGLGVSGAIQHLAGMQSAETIVAVNLDAAAPIFQVADFGIVGDLFEVLPALENRFGKGVNRQ